MKVFVYGTLKKGYGNHRLLESVNASLLGPDVIAGRLYSGPWFPMLVAPEELGELVEGEVYEIPEEHESAALLRLDTLEGVPHLYQRIETTTAKGHKVFAYLWMRPTEGLMHLPEGKWEGRG